MHTNTRQSGIELLKCIAICMIILDHAVEIVSSTNVYALDVTQATENASYFMCILLHYLGMMADVIFIVCSAWFLVDSERVNEKKITRFLGDKYFITVVFMAITLLLGNKISRIIIMRTLMPGECWFVVCYLIYYAFHPCLNAILKYMNKSRLLLLNTVIILLYFTFSFLVRDDYVPSNDYYCRLMGFFAIYFITAYVKKYMCNFSESKRKNVVLLLAGIVGQLCLLIVSNKAGLSGKLADGMTRWDTLINPFSLIVAIGALNLAKRWSEENKTINYLSSLSLLVYLIHANRYVRTEIMPKMVNVWIEACYPPLLLTVFIVTLVLLFGAVTFSIFYKHTLQIIVYCLCDALTLLMKNVYARFQCWMMRRD